MPPDARMHVHAPVQYAWTLLRAGAFRLDGGSMFGVVPKAIWARLVEPDEANRIPLQTNCLLLRGAGRTVVFEAGYGDKWTDKDRAIFALERRTIVDALREVDVAPEDVDSVIVTHLHFDHAGGLTRLGPSGEPVTTFPRAEIVVQREEWHDALANKSTMTRTYLRSHLDAIHDRVRLVDGAAEVLPGIKVEPDPGHTWGQQMIWFRDEHGVVCFPGDVMPTVNHVGLAFNMGYDMLPYENMLSKRRMLERAASEHWRLVLDHEPGHPVVHVHPDPGATDRWRLVGAVPEHPRAGRT